MYIVAYELFIKYELLYVPHTPQCIFSSQRTQEKRQIKTLPTTANNFYSTFAFITNSFPFTVSRKTPIAAKTFYEMFSTLKNTINHIFWSIEFRAEKRRNRTHQTIYNLIYSFPFKSNKWRNKN